MLKTAIITAFNPGNMGMYTVDRAIYDCFGNQNKHYKSLCAHSDFKKGYYTLNRLGLNIGTKKKWKEGVVTKEAYSATKQLEGFDRLIFWGDFTLNPEYGYKDWEEYDLRFKKSGNGREAVERWRKLFSTSRLPVSQVMTFGQNFQSELLAAGNPLAEELRRLVSGVTLALPRDSVSFRNLQSLNLPNCQVTPACDPAMLKITDHHESVQENHFAYYFSRSNIGSPDQLVSLLSQKLKLRSLELENWNYCKGDYESRWSDLRESIKTASFVLTDTYHCAINAISLNKIPIVFANPAPMQKGTLGDFKKKVMLADCGLSDFLFEIDRDGEVSPSTQDHLVEMAAGLCSKELDNSLQKLDDYRNKVKNIKKLIYDFVEFD